MCNPYLTLALILAAGLDGIDKHLALPSPFIENAYEISPEQLLCKEIDVLPGSLYDALVCMKQSEFVQNILGIHLFESYLNEKTKEWNDYNQTVHQWEIQNYL